MPNIDYLRQVFPTNRRVHSLLYLYVVTFICFVDQLCAVKAVEFLKFDSYALDKFVLPLFCLCFGVIVRFYRKTPRSRILLWTIFAHIFFLMNIAYGFRVLFLPSTALLFVLLGQLICEAFSDLEGLDIIIVDAAGAVSGLVLSYIGMKYVDIELQLLLSAATLSLLYFVYRPIKFWSFALLPVVISFSLIAFHVHTDALNFLRSRETIPPRMENSKTAHRTAQFQLTNPEYKYAGYKWTSLDRVDVFENGSMTVLYYNNEPWTSLIKDMDNALPDFPERLHVIGFGCGTEIASLKNKKYTEIVGSEINPYAFSFASTHLPQFEGVRVRLYNQDGFLLSKDFPNYFDLVWAVFPNSVVNISPTAPALAISITVEDVKDMYHSLRENGVLVLGVNFHEGKSFDLSSIASTLAMLKDQGLSVKDSFHNFAKKRNNSLRVYNFIKKGIWTSSDSEKVRHLDGGLSEIQNFSDHIGAHIIADAVENSDDFLRRHPPLTRKRLVRAQQTYLSAQTSIILATLVIIALMMMRVSDGVHISFINLLSLVTGFTFALWQIYLIRSLGLSSGTTSIAYVFASVTLIGGSFFSSIAVRSGYLTRYKIVPIVLVILSFATLFVIDFTDNYYRMRDYTLWVALGLIIASTFVSLAYALIAKASNDFTPLYSMNLFGYMMGILTSLIIAYTWGFVVFVPVIIFLFGITVILTRRLPAVS